MPTNVIHKLVPVDEITLDNKNPRIARIIEMYGANPSEESIRLALGSGDSQKSEGGGYTTFMSLRESIKTNGGIIHPIILNRTGPNNYIAIEGNTRVLIYREFKEQKIRGNWDLISSIVYDNLEQNSIDAIRLQAHLVGPREWDPYSKAKYLYQLRNNDNLPFNQLVDFCGGNKKEVETYIQAYIDMETFYRKIIPDDSQFDPTRFSAFVEVQKPNIKSSILRAKYSMEDFSRWVHERLIHPLSTVRKLPIILSNEKSKKIFLKDGAEEAIKALIIPSSIDFSQVPLEQLSRVLYERLGNITLAEIRNLRKDLNGEKAQALLDLNDELKATCEEILREEAS